jgi:septum formation protein
LLRQAGAPPDRVSPANIDETPLADETPLRLVQRLAAAKAAAVHTPGQFTLGADTLVCVGRRILPKTETEAEAKTCLNLLSGRAHQVMTAVALIAPDGRVSRRVTRTRVKFKRLTREEVAAYLATGEWRGKAGGYGVQGRAGAFVTALSGSYTAVVGLPLYETMSLLTGAGYRP